MNYIDEGIDRINIFKVDKKFRDFLRTRLTSMMIKYSKKFYIKNL